MPIERIERVRLRRISARPWLLFHRPGRWVPDGGVIGIRWHLHDECDGAFEPVDAIGRERQIGCFDAATCFRIDMGFEVANALAPGLRILGLVDQLTPESGRQIQNIPRRKPRQGRAITLTRIGACPAAMCIMRQVGRERITRGMLARQSRRALFVFLPGAALIEISEREMPVAMESHVMRRATCMKKLEHRATESLGTVWLGTGVPDRWCKMIAIISSHLRHLPGLKNSGQKSR
ncbi:hypothetical protein N5A93_19045 [Roseovarius sp. EGI FJ00037]|uniref:hypothetical protein n=1 Tax=Roseovarius salincola TaxID=2978479 RepID=UPI0022A85D24|nr:hypothetical protein [Roseovarius sp. EGI FJ00037]MCZ0814320.1 hypothetical protein [Roseovarius sp. EGI FJ00037]